MLYVLEMRIAARAAPRFRCSDSRGRSTEALAGGLTGLQRT